MAPEIIQAVDAKTFWDIIESGGAAAVLFLANLAQMAAVVWQARMLAKLQDARVADKDKATEKLLEISRQSLETVNQTNKITENNVAAVQAAHQKIETMSALINSRG